MVGAHTDDGVHWDNTAHRWISNLILSHIADAWGIRPLNGRYTYIVNISTCLLIRVCHRDIEKVLLSTHAICFGE